MNEAAIQAGVTAFERALDRLAPAHYRLSGEELRASLDTDQGRLQFARLLGVLVKEPFTDPFPRRPSTRTRARIGLKWKPAETLREAAPGTWQFAFLRALLREDGTLAADPADDAVLDYLETEARRQTHLGQHIFRAFHRRICGSAEATDSVRRAIGAGKGEGAGPADAAENGSAEGMASRVAGAVAALFPEPFAVVAAPVIGGVALLLCEIGVEGFCSWSRDVSEGETLRAAEAETEARN
jgi:hypothetical protein